MDAGSIPAASTICSIYFNYLASLSGFVLTPYSRELLLTFPWF
jgi:hypothetical protein